MNKIKNIYINFALIIPTFNRPYVLKETIESVLRQEILPTVFLVIDQSDNAHTEHLCSKYDLIRYIHIKRKSLTAARNTGIKIAEQNKVDFWAFLDDDVELMPGYFKNMALVYSDCLNVIGVGAWVITPGLKKWGFINNLMRKIGMFDHYADTVKILPNFLGTYLSKRPDSICQVEWLSGCAMSARNLGLNNEYFDESLISYAQAEDRDYSYRLNKRGRIVIDPSIKLIHKVSAFGRIATRKKIFMTAVHQYYLVRKHFKNSFISNMAYWWNMIIRFIIAFIMIINGKIKGDKNIYCEGKDIIDSIFYVFEKRGHLNKLDLKFFHEFLKTP